MENKKKTIIMTLLSCLLFCLIIVLSSLSPLSETGNAANDFNSTGMWLAIAMMVLLYGIPLLIYSLGLEWMKYIMASLCALGLLSQLFLFILVAFIGYALGIMPSLLLLLATTGVAFVMNIIWFFGAFSKKSEASM